MDDCLSVPNDPDPTWVSHKRKLDCKMFHIGPKWSLNKWEVMSLCTEQCVMVSGSTKRKSSSTVGT